MARDNGTAADLTPPRRGRPTLALASLVDSLSPQQAQRALHYIAVYADISVAGKPYTDEIARNIDAAWLAQVARAIRGVA